jgi:hypothetical protein
MAEILQPRADKLSASPRVERNGPTTPAAPAHKKEAAS